MYWRIRTVWLSVTIKQKLKFYTAMVILIIAVSAAFSVKVMGFALGNFQEILDDNAKCHDFQEAIELEIQAFTEYARERSEEKRNGYEMACVRSEHCLRSLPFDYGRIGEERYARTWNIQNGYTSYSKSREALLEMDSRGSSYISSLYRVYHMQGYLQDYARRLVQETMQAGNTTYLTSVPTFQRMPYMILLFAGVMVLVTLLLTGLLSNTLVGPVLRLTHCSRRIAENDFSQEDLVIDNRDEMGELVLAFNKMKHATEGYINTLKKNHEMTELLRREELERIEMEKQLDTARLEVLKSQINPHFLFNTLNMIGSMAKLEDAATTERMIYSLSSLFRYNLKTSEQFVPLEQELKIVQDYIYIQQMRFGSRVLYDSQILVEPARVIIPSFTLQPLIENAVIHGLARKEEGGRIHLRIWPKGQSVVISVADTGAGMTKEELARLRERMASRPTSRTGIGLGNISKRIHILYENGELNISSRVGCGTVVQMVIPQKGEK